MTRGLYLVVEGGDATGKSHQCQKLVPWIERQGYVVRRLREPGSTPVGEALRQLLLAPETGDLLPLTEALLFSAARAEMLHREVAPAVARGEVVLVERCYLSTLVYQGLAQGGDVAALQAVTAAVHADLWPDRIFLLDVDEETRVRRGSRRTADRIEARQDGYHVRVRQGYLDLADERVECIDARGTIEVVQDELRRHVGALLARERCS